MAHTFTFTQYRTEIWTTALTVQAETLEEAEALLEAETPIFNKSGKILVGENAFHHVPEENVDVYELEEIDGESNLVPLCWKHRANELGFIAKTIRKHATNPIP